MPSRNLVIKYDVTAQAAAEADEARQGVAPRKKGPNKDKFYFEGIIGTQSRNSVSPTECINLHYVYSRHSFAQTLRYRVCWKGYPEEENTWQGADSLYVHHTAVSHRQI